MFRGVDVAAVDRVVVDKFELLAQRVVGLDELGVEAFLLDLVSAAVFVEAARA